MRDWWWDTHEEAAYEILSLFVKALGKRILELLDFLPGEIFGQALEGEASGDHLVKHASESPQVRARTGGSSARGMGCGAPLTWGAKNNGVTNLLLVSLASRSSGDTY